MEENKCEEFNAVKKCGLIMPISSIDGCTELHWQEVMQILRDAIKHAGYEAELVSNADDVGIIQKRIIQNIYENPIVVCDVSGKNPNVMFELGMRLAFDKPTIIVKDDKTGYSFDTSPIEHLEYPRDLRYNKIIEFKEKLSKKISATYETSIKDPNFSTFLKHFGKFTVAKLETKEISKEEYILEELKDVKALINQMNTMSVKRKSIQLNNYPQSIIDYIQRLLNESTDKRRYDKNNILDVIMNDDNFVLKGQVNGFGREAIENIISTYLNELDNHN